MKKEIFVYLFYIFIILCFYPETAAGIGIGVSPDTLHFKEESATLILTNPSKDTITYRIDAKDYLSQNYLGKIKSNGKKILNLTLNKSAVKEDINGTIEILFSQDNKNIAGAIRIRIIRMHKSDHSRSHMLIITCMVIAALSVSLGLVIIRTRRNFF